MMPQRGQNLGLHPMTQPVTAPTTEVDGNRCPYSSTAGCEDSASLTARLLLVICVIVMLVVPWAITRVHLFLCNRGLYQFLVATDGALFENLVVHSRAFSTYVIVQ